MDILSLHWRKYLYTAALMLSFSLQPLLAKSEHSNKYTVTNLVTNTRSSTHQDPRLVNPWGLSISEDGDLIVADNGTSLVTSYKDNGSIHTFTLNAPSSPTGIVHNDSKCHFVIPATQYPAKLLLATENGTILAYNRNVDPNNAVVVADRSSFGSVYKGLTISKCHEHAFLYVADFFNAKIDVFDSSFNYVTSFADANIPNGFAPFNIQTIHKKLYITFAKQLAPNNQDDQAGLGNGFVDIFNNDGTFLKRLISNGLLNSPWGLTLAKDKFGKFSHALLVGNFGDGKINAYHSHSGAFLGQLKDEFGDSILIDGLWSLKFGESKSHLYFTSGPNSEANGLVGVIQPQN